MLLFFVVVVVAVEVVLEIVLNVMICEYVMMAFLVVVKTAMLRKCV